MRQVRRRYSTVALEQLHWLPVEQRIKYKVALLTYKALLTGEPTYLRKRNEIKIEKHVKFLGMIFDQKQTWRMHIKLSSCILS